MQNSKQATDVQIKFGKNSPKKSIKAIEKHHNNLNPKQDKTPTPWITDQNRIFFLKNENKNTTWKPVERHGSEIPSWMKARKGQNFEIRNENLRKIRDGYSLESQKTKINSEMEMYLLPLFHRLTDSSESSSSFSLSLSLQFYYSAWRGLFLQMFSSFSAEFHSKRTLIISFIIIIIITITIVMECVRI